MKKIPKLLAVVFALALFLFNLPVAQTYADDGVITLKVCNCEDYIDEDVCADFEQYMPFIWHN